VAKTPSSWSFGSLVFLQSALIAAAPLAIVALIGWRVVVPQITEAVERHHQALTKATAVQVDTHLASARRELLATVELVEAVPRGATQGRQVDARDDAIDRILDATVGTGRLYETVYVAGTDAIVHSVGLPVARRVARKDLKGIDLSRRDFVTQAMRTGEPVWSPSFLSAVSGRLSVALAMPAPSGVLVAELALVQFSYFLRDLPADAGAIALMLDRRGYVIAHPRPDVAGQQVSLSDQALIRDGFASGAAIGRVHFEGRDMIGALQTIPGVNWAVLVAQPEATAVRLLDSVILAMLGGFAVSIAVALAAAYLIAKRSALRLRAYAQNAAALADGRYDLAWPSTRITEFIRLADDLQRMSQSIRDREASLKSSEARYREVVQSSADLITEVDAEGRFLFVNDTTARTYGLPPEECRGRLAFDFVHPDDRTMTQEAFLRWLASTSDTMQIENRQVGMDGKVYSIVWSIHAHRSADGEIIEFSSIGHDMTEYRRAEAEIRRLALVASSTSNAVLITDAAGKVNWVNKACEQLTGFSREELEGGGPWDRRAGPASPDALVAWMTDELVGGRGFNAVEISVVRKDGEARWHEVEVQPVRDARGRLIQSVVIESDVTARREAEEARKSSEERLRATLENTPNVAIQWYDANGIVTYWNRSSERLFGIPAEQAVGRPGGEVFADIFGPPAGGFLGDAMAQIDATGEAVGPFESTMRRPDGSSGCILSTTFAIPGVGSVGGRTYVCMDIDISEQKALLAALTASEQKFLAVFQSSPVPIVVSRFSSKIEIVDCNVAWERQFGYERDNVVGRSGPEIGYWVDLRQREVMLARLETEGMVEDLEIQIRKADGTLLVCLASGQLITVGNERFAVIAYRDVTEERHTARALLDLNAGLEGRVAERTAALAAANDELRNTLDTLQRAQSELIRSEKLAALGALVAGVAHELNTPIGNGLMAATTLDDHTAEFGRILASGSIRRSALDAFVRDARTAAAIVVRNLQKASELVTSFKQVAVDQTSAQRREFALAEVVSEIVLTLRPTFRKTPFTVDYEVPADLRLDSYPGPLGQVFSNLINNALLHGFEGRDHGSVRIVATGGGGRIRMSISDDGCGIDRAHLPRIFDPFFTTKLGRGGSGLGLHIVHNIVTRVLGGTLNVDSDESGTRFTIDIPCTAPRQVPADAF
jgi:PAS domain S-box-containing protein